MGYYVRAFCKSDKVPTIAELENNLKSNYPQVHLDTPDTRDGVWKTVEYHYKEGKEPISVECNINNGDDSLAAEECREFIEEIGNPGISPAKHKVLAHLKNTKYIISSQLLSDIDQDGYHLNGEFLKLFVQNQNGLIQADGEGFYQNSKIIVKIK